MMVQAAAAFEATACFQMFWHGSRASPSKIYVPTLVGGPEVLEGWVGAGSADCVSAAGF